MPGIQDKGEKVRCIRVLAEVYRKHVILPRSYIVSDVEQVGNWKSGRVADIWTGRVGQDDICIKAFRQYGDANQEAFKGVGRTSFGKYAPLILIVPGVLLPRSKVEARFASQRASFTWSFRTRDGSSVWLDHPPDVEQHHRVHQGTPRCQQVATGGRNLEL